MKADIHSFLTTCINQSPVTGPSLIAIISKAAENGHAVPDVKRELFLLCDHPEIQKAWGNWETITNREEIRLRLQAILAAGSMDSSLVPFVLFFFRASDPVVYQTAARIVGKWLYSEKEFQNYINNYVSLKKVDPEKTIVLNSQRARRRLLVAFAEHYGAHGPGLEIGNRTIRIAYPVKPFDPGEVNPSSLDFSVILLALAILEQHGAADSTKIARDTISALPDIAHSSGARDRNTIRTWGMLLAAYRGKIQEKKEFFTHALSRALDLYRTESGFSDKLYALFRIDEILRSGAAAFEGSSINPEDLLPEGMDQEFAVFCRIRLFQWSGREGNVGIMPEITLENRIINQNNAIQLMLQSIRSNESSQAFLSLVQNLHRDESWQLQSVSERVLKAFLLLDISTHCEQLPADELKQIISTLRGNQKPAPDQSEDKIHFVLTAVLRRLIDAEHTARAQICDSKLIHKIYDESLLLQLLPTSDDSQLLPVLADAFENRIRLLLAADPDFNLDHYLYLISVREPNRKFYRYLKELSTERTYTDSKGNTAYFREKVHYLYQLPDTGSEEITKESRFWKSIHQIRGRLQSIADESNLFTALGKIEHELDGTGTESLSPSSTLHDLLNIVQPGVKTLIQSGFPAHTDLFHTGLNRQLFDLKNQLALNRKRLVPAHFSGADEAGETTQRLKADIHQIAAILGPVLGSEEAALLSRIEKQLDGLLIHWAEQIYSLSGYYQQLISEQSADSQKSWNRLFDKATESSVSDIRSELLGIIASNVLNTGISGSQRNWYTRYQFLMWACQPSTLKRLSETEKAKWLSLLHPHWEKMVQTAMELKQEARVLQMVREPDLAPLRRTDSAKLLLGEVKTWCYNRYDFNHASVCNREISPESNFISVQWKTFREYFAHYANVWVALIVGVILMFDFGDPWTELAEMGNVGGVLITFLFGVAGTYMYVFYDLKKQITFVKTDPFQWASLFGRVGIFLAITLAFTVAVIMVFWFMFSETDQVLHGFEGLLHVMAWTGFALFMGVFFGLIGKQ